MKFNMEKVICKLSFRIQVPEFEASNWNFYFNMEESLLQAFICLLVILLTLVSTTLLMELAGEPEKRSDNKQAIPSVLLIQQTAEQTIKQLEDTSGTSIEGESNNSSEVEIVLSNESSDDASSNTSEVEEIVEGKIQESIPPSDEIIYDIPEAKVGYVSYEDDNPPIVPERETQETTTMSSGTKGYYSQIQYSEGELDELIFIVSHEVLEAPEAWDCVCDGDGSFIAPISDDTLDMMQQWMCCTVLNRVIDPRFENSIHEVLCEGYYPYMDASSSNYWFYDYDRVYRNCRAVLDGTSPFELPTDIYYERSLEGCGVSSYTGFWYKTSFGSIITFG